jgi:hypothetical protein
VFDPLCEDQDQVVAWNVDLGPVLRLILAEDLVEEFDDLVEAERLVFGELFLEPVIEAGRVGKLPPPAIPVKFERLLGDLAVVALLEARLLRDGHFTPL